MLHISEERQCGCREKISNDYIEYVRAGKKITDDTVAYL